MNRWASLPAPDAGPGAELQIGLRERGLRQELRVGVGAARAAQRRGAAVPSLPRVKAWRKPEYFGWSMAT